MDSNRDGFLPFCVEEVASPRLKWMRHHGITTERVDGKWIALKRGRLCISEADFLDEADEFLRDTEDEAVAYLMERVSIPCFNPDEWRSH